MDIGLMPSATGAESRFHEGIIKFTLDFLSDSWDAISLLGEEVNVVDQEVGLSDATILRITQLWLLLAIRRSLLANDILQPGLARIALQLQVVDQALHLRAWFFDPSRGTAGTHEHASDNQRCGENLRSLNHHYLRPLRIRACNIARRRQRFHRIGRSKRPPSFLHPDSVGFGDSVDMLDRLFEIGAVCASV